MEQCLRNFYSSETFATRRDLARANVVSHFDAKRVLIEFPMVPFSCLSACSRSLDVYRERKRLCKKGIQSP
jgi:hypothetical protein